MAMAAGVKDSENRDMGGGCQTIMARWSLDRVEFIVRMICLPTLISMRILGTRHTMKVPPLLMVLIEYW